MAITRVFWELSGSAGNEGFPSDMTWSRVRKFIWSERPEPQPALKCIHVRAFEAA